MSVSATRFPPSQRLSEYVAAAFTGLWVQSYEHEDFLTEIARSCKQNRVFIVVLSPVVQIPVELERQFVVIEHDLPGRQQLDVVANGK